MARHSGGVRFASLPGIFDSTSLTLFADEHSHLTGIAHRQVAARIADEVLPLRPSSGGAAAGPHAQGPFPPDPAS